MPDRPPNPPKAAGADGRSLWRAVLREYELEEHELVLLRQAVRVADVCSDLQAIVDDEGPLLSGKAHPALVELRAQRILLARLVVALRVPMGEQGAEDESTPTGSRRTQYRGTRGVYGVRSVS